MTLAAGWWRTAVVHQVYVRSFADADGDGVGDLAGLTAHLDAVAGLGADAVWLTPFYRSPQADHGYDVADHRDVDPLFGDLAALDALVARAHDLGLGVVLDLVPNHVSDQHPWFRAAVAAGPGAPERRRFHVRPGRGGPGTDGSRPPNGWRSVFGGPAWTRLPDGEWYLHLFAPEQPDLDWTHPDVRADWEETLRFWVARGADGFRVDVAGGLAKDPAYGDVRRVSRGPAGAGAGQDAGVVVPGGEATPLAPPPHPHWDRPEVHEVYREWRRVLDDAAPDVFAVAEVWGASERTAAFARPDELGQAFAFAVLLTPWSAAALRRTVEAQLSAHRAVGALPAWVIGSHDVVRAATRLGPERALALHLFLLALPGAFYLYAGDELGLPHVDVPPSAWQDPQSLRSGGRLPNRDGARIPLPWETSAPGLGFTTGTPWLPVPDDWGRYAREAQVADPASTWSVLHRALAVRRALWTAAPDDVTWLSAPPGVLVARRGDAVVVLNASARRRDLRRLLADVPGRWRVVARSDRVARSDPDDPAVRPSSCVWVAVADAVTA